MKGVSSGLREVLNSGTKCYSLDHWTALTAYCCYNTMQIVKLFGIQLLEFTVNTVYTFFEELKKIISENSLLYFTNIILFFAHRKGKTLHLRNIQKFL